MLRVGLTGGIGAGKSAAAAAFARRGAVVLDADQLAREVLAPGTEGLAAVAAEFGSGVLGPDGSLDRAALAAVVFADPAARRRLEALTHPRIADLTRSRSRRLAPGTVLVHDVPLLVEAGRAGDYDAVVVVEAPLALRLERLERTRAMPPQEARARMAAQASDEQRRAVADIVIVNDGSLPALDGRVEAAWLRLRDLPRPVRP